MSVIPKMQLTVKDYLKFERKSEERREYLDVEIFAMSGAKRNHNSEIEVASIESRIAMREVYDKIDFAAK